HQKMPDWCDAAADASGVAQEGGETPPLPPADPPGRGGVSPPSVPFNPEGAQAEIEELRRKLSRLGAVNLDSLQELADLQLRAGALRVQYDDVTAAQKSLQEIITRINQDSRRLFTET